MSYRIALAVVAALGLAGCVSETRTVVASDDVCFTAYGFKVSSPEYRLCRDREAEARRQGRTTPSYSEARIVADAQAACQSYGLHPYSDRYEQCVRNEHEARRPM
jgi:hypothetical protein